MQEIIPASLQEIARQHGGRVEITARPQQSPHFGNLTVAGATVYALDKEILVHLTRNASNTEGYLIDSVQYEGFTFSDERHEELVSVVDGILTGNVTYRRTPFGKRTITVYDKDDHRHDPY